MKLRNFLEIELSYPLPPSIIPSQKEGHEQCDQIWQFIGPWASF